MVGGIVVGQGEHAAATRVAESGGEQVLGQPGVGRECRGIGREVREVEVVDPLRIDVEHREAVMPAVERAAEQCAGLTVAAHDVERLV